LGGSGSGRKDFPLPVFWKITGMKRVGKIIDWVPHLQSKMKTDIYL
jgi:hypothetical protein